VDTNQLLFGDNLELLAGIESKSVTLIYIDPPFNTGKVQSRAINKMKKSKNGTHKGYLDEMYEKTEIAKYSYPDSFDDFIDFLIPRLKEAKRLLTDDGTLYLHLDYREVHYAKVVADAIFGRENFLNEIIWAYDYGAKSKQKWPAKHDNILVYVKDINKYYFNSSKVDREPYMAPSLVTAEKAKRGKLPTDVWWHTIVSPTGKEKTGYPTQKPVAILRRIINASSEKGDLVLDFFAGSGTTGIVAAELGRSFICIDKNPEAIAIMKQRFDEAGVEYEIKEKYFAIPR
jgi:site-specific DNA-methyltransferase (adenine-specific)